MIAKHVPMRSPGKSDFAGLADYITDAQEKTERLGAVQVTNCEAGTVQAAIAEALATQHLNTRAKGDKTYHLLVSFRTGEKPGVDTLRAIEERICMGLGYGEHQRISAVHYDTDNLHIHIAINKIHPKRHTMHEPYYPHKTLAELCTILERDYRLEPDNHIPRKSGSENRAADMERHAGVESLLGWIKRECLDEIRSAATWTDLHRVMHENGLELRERGNGFVIEAGDGTRVKASTLSRELSKSKLEDRLGPFEASPQRQAQAKRHYQKSPIRLRVDTVELYAKYKAEQQTSTAARAAELDEARKRKERRIEAAKQSSRLRRTAIKTLTEGRLVKKLLYAQASQALRNEIQSINKQYWRERQGFYDAFRRRTWADWLKQEAMQGSAEALTALRAREASQGLKGNTVKGDGQARPGSGQAPTLDNITKKGTIIFRAGRSAVRDDGDRLQISREASHEGLQQALTLAMERYGSRITVNGAAEFKAQIIRAAVDSRLPITFADPILESRRQALLIKEHSHDKRTAQHRVRAGRGIGRSESGVAADRHATRSEPYGRAGGGRGTGGNVSAGVSRKPDIGGIGRIPPPQSRHRLRGLSQLGVVRIAGGSEVLLPRDVSGHLEQQGAKPDNALRRGVSGASVSPEQITAAKKYIDEREQKRLKINDIPKHNLYNGQKGAFAYAGVRTVEGQALALLKQGDDVMVMPIDQATTRRLKRVGIGDFITITPIGSIKTTSGRSR
ncbi:TraI/MobA(P) family conjugative relaxase [Methylotuvimicrobium buryatense]|uniref:TraI/MobA(P) family conjugative relaxase n=1 Tax=Methylotuvimicrobium buryatense TaxID=95641 RepID=UPI000349593F|nr:TraI/MobA(P) family conjugative relaxase [Methylotuvimicrobium buryatense]